VSDPGLRRIAFVTRAYPRMRAAALAVGFGPIVIWFLRSTRQQDARGALIAAAGFLATGYLVRYAERWFDARFGRVVRPWDRKFLWWPLVFGASMPFVVSFDDWSLNSGGPSPILLSLAALGLWLTIRDWPYRPQLLVFFATCLASGLALGHVSRRPDFLAWRMRADAAVVLAWMLVGCLDLLTLRRVLSAPSVERQRSGT
jgi:hypothetical protein